MSDFTSKPNSCLLTGAIITIVLALIAALCLLGGCLMCSSFVENIGSSESSFQTGKLKKLNKSILVPGDSDQQIAVIYLDFVIGENVRKTENILTELNRAVNDISVDAIVLYVNTPGGGVTASDVIYNGVKKAREEKPVVVYMDDIAASGGYYVSCAADHIIANANTLTGSIGVIMSTINLTSALDKIGVSSQVFKSGDFKDMLSPMRPTTEEEKEYVQSLVMESYENFLNIVSEGRKISIEDLQARNAVDGRVISGRKALEIGLVDGNGYLEDAIREAEKRAGIEEGEAEVFRYKRNELEDFFNSILAESKAEKKIQVELTPNPLPQLKPGVPYLLPEAYISGASTH